MFLLFFSDWRMGGGGFPVRWPSSHRGCAAAPELRVLFFRFFRALYPSLLPIVVSKPKISTEQKTKPGSKKAWMIKRLPFSCYVSILVPDLLCFRFWFRICFVSDYGSGSALFLIRPPDSGSVSLDWACGDFGGALTNLVTFCFMNWCWVPVLNAAVAFGVCLMKVDVVVKVWVDVLCLVGCDEWFIHGSWWIFGCLCVKLLCSFFVNFRPFFGSLCSMNFIP